jgi:phenylalanyl-tRNA synthetase alpha chain
MSDPIREAEPAALARVSGSATLDELRSVSADLLGKKGTLTEARKQLGALDPEARREAGKVLNEVWARITDAVAAREAELAAEARRSRLEAERLDLTEARATAQRGHLHLVTQARDRLEDVFVGMGFTVEEGPEIESDWYNFEALNMPPAHPARGMWDTLYVDLGEPETVLLRTHTSPVQIRLMESTPPPIYAVMPGRVYRRDTADATHTPVFHQIEGLVVDRGITFADLAGTIDAFTKAFFGSEFTSRLRPSFFPFTEPSAEFDIGLPDGSWLELGGCGMVNPKVFEAVGYDPEEWTGFAFGFGIDRMAKTFHGVDDLRELFVNDIRFLEQF